MHNHTDATTHLHDAGALPIANLAVLAKNTARRIVFILTTCMHLCLLLMTIWIKPMKAAIGKMLSAISQAIFRRYHSDKPSNTAAHAHTQQTIRVFGRIHGVITGTKANHATILLQWRPGKLRTIDRLNMWLDWLMLCANQDDNTPNSQLANAYFVANDAHLILSPVSPQRAQALLATYVAFWQHAHRQALPFFPETAWAWLQALNKAKQSTRQSPGNLSWQNSTQVSSQSDRGSDPEGAEYHFQRAFPISAPTSPHLATGRSAYSPHCWRLRNNGNLNKLQPLDA